LSGKPGNVREYDRDFTENHRNVRELSGKNLVREKLPI